MRKLFCYLLIVLSLNSCRLLNPSIMFKTDRNYRYSEFKDIKDTLGIKVYKISPNDIIEFRLFSNDGFKIIDLTSLQDGSSSGILTKSTMDYIVDNNGCAKLPVLGKVKIENLTLRQAEDTLQELYSKYYNRPFVMLKVTNRRVIVFPGMGGAAKVVPLINNNTTLVEALAIAGGITSQGKAYKVKLIRGDLKNPEVYLIDLSTIEGIKKANLIIQAGDIIYVEPRLYISRNLLNEIVPIVSILTSLLLVYSLVKIK